MANSDEQVVSDLVSLVVDEIVEEMANGVDISAEAGPSGASNDEPDDWTCAICLESVATANLAVVKGCGHTYCVNCIVHWASTRTGAPRCPTCKAPFTQLKCHRNLDGSFSGAMVEESVVLIAHSSWFQNWLSEHERLKQLSRNNPGIVPPAPQAPVQRSEQALLQEEWAEEALYGYFESQFDDDDEFEDMYLSRGPRMAIGNRPYGPNGFIASGRKLAAPKRGKGKGKGGGGGAGTSTAVGSNKAGAAPSGNNQATGGRRAQRKAKRAAADARDDL